MLVKNFYALTQVLHLPEFHKALSDPRQLLMLADETAVPINTNTMVKSYKERLFHLARRATPYKFMDNAVVASAKVGILSCFARGTAYVFTL